MRIFASRQCANYARTSYTGAGEARVACVTFAVGGSCLVFVVFKPRWPRCAVIPDSISIAKERHCPRSESSVSECVTHIWPIPMPMVCNNIPLDIPERDPPRTYVRTYVRMHVCTYILCENRSSIHSLALMHSAIMIDYRVYTAYVHVGLEWLLVKH